ncbi:hypothetical protein JVT61DRAFT_10301 [Boletus reticuloceps]|uniref:Uncharacterized protein n=1 Tax=Boletus reticuloceps TaxID=495285 RepID=A0A8I2YUQ9_9AGAM|nr:hypothetical protein JVT61DRAFT_10301 [Boletus reticuloceps]
MDPPPEKRKPGRPKCTKNKPTAKNTGRPRKDGRPPQKRTVPNDVEGQTPGEASAPTFATSEQSGPATTRCRSSQLPPHQVQLGDAARERELTVARAPGPVANGNDYDHTNESFGTIQFKPEDFFKPLGMFEYNDRDAHDRQIHHRWVAEQQGTLLPEHLEAYYKIWIDYCNESNTIALNTDAANRIRALLRSPPLDLNPTAPTALPMTLRDTLTAPNPSTTLEIFSPGRSAIYSTITRFNSQHSSISMPTLPIKP